jgi:hypothetical protein
MKVLIDTLGPYAAVIIAGAIVLLALAFGWRDFLRLSWTRIWAISSVCFSESIRRRVLLITPLAILGVLIVSQLQRPFDEQDAIRQTTKFALFTTGLVVVIVGILLACTSLPKEIENRVIFTVVTKPTTRLEIVLGKTLGFARVSATILLIMGLFTAIYLQARAWNLRRTITQRLDAGAVDPISRATLEHYREYGLLNAKRFADRPELQVYGRLPEPGTTRRYASAGGDNQIIVPFELTPEMFGDPEQGFRMAVAMKVGYEKDANAAATPGEDAATTQPAEITGPTPLLSSTRPTTAPPQEPAVAIGFLDIEETFLIGSNEIRGGEPIQLPPDPNQPVLIELSPDNVAKLAKAASNPNTSLVYFAINGAAGGYLYSVDNQPVQLLMGMQAPNGQVALAKPIEAIGAPIFRGGYSRYGQQVRGSAEHPMVAVYRFRNAQSTDDDTVNFEMRLGIDRGGTEGAEDEDTITRVSLQIRDAKGNLSALRIITPETNRTSYFSFPKTAIGDGNFELIVRCVTNQHAIGLRPGGLLMVTDTGSFYGNLLKSLLIFWLLSVLVVAVAISCSTFVSWPIAVVLCIVILLGKWGVDQLGDATKPGIGAQVATDFGFRDPRQARVVSESVEVLSKSLNIISRILPDISQYPATEDIERGVSIPWRTLWASAAESLKFGIPLLLLGYVVLKNKEVAP